METKDEKLKNLFAKVEKLLHVKGQGTYQANQELDLLLNRALDWCDGTEGTDSEGLALSIDLDVYIRKIELSQKTKSN